MSAPDGLERARQILSGACGGRLKTDFSMAPLTTFRIGGPAALYLEPDSIQDLEAAGRAVAESGVDSLVIGKGSNLLVSDEGFKGLVIRLGRSFRWAARSGDRLTAGGAMPLPALSGVALHHGLTGLGFGVAIPATVGGAVRMNAGAHGGEVSDVAESVEVFLLREGSTAHVPASDAGFSYRRSELNPDSVIVSATFLLRQGEPGEIRQEMDEAREWRRRTQPLAEPNCGSVFKNPPNDHAARLIEASGGKGLAVGGASVSAKHANFIVAGEGATASDVASLIAMVRSLVEAKTDISLEPEVHLVGEFPRAL